MSKVYVVLQKNADSDRLAGFTPTRDRPEVNPAGMTEPGKHPTLESYRASVPGIGRRYLADFEISRIAHRFTDVLVIGSGIAGLSAALAAAVNENLEVLVLAKDSLEESATRWAQGGIAAVVLPQRTGDSLEAHIEDTIEVAAGLSDEENLRIMVGEGVERVRELVDLGADFDRDGEGNLQLTREGAHSFERILHRGDTTGQEIIRALIEAVSNRKNIFCRPGAFAIDLLDREGTCIGALMANKTGDLEAVWARQTILATGGAGRLYRETTNPTVATGDGLAMAFRAGAELMDLEFIQFHPTTLYLAGADRFLITEAIRGEGGVLRTESGEAFMKRFHELADLAPRDVVSRAILDVMKETGDNKVWHDLGNIPDDQIRERFPRILEISRSFGIDILSQPIPVRPSAHYSIGGVRTDSHGQTSIPCLLAAGEVACTGVHGANRLGSNSLLEGIVFGHRSGLEAARAAAGLDRPDPFPPGARNPATTAARKPTGNLDLDDLLSSLKSLLWHKVGVERNGEDLSSALEQLSTWTTYPLGADFRDVESWTLQNMLQIAWLVTFSALGRKESRGVHYRADYKERDDAEFRRHIKISRADFPT